MGNRAVITTGQKLKDQIGVYLHWNGGRDSVSAFCKYCKIKGHRPPEQDNYGWARFCQVVGNFFGGTTSIGVDKVSCLDCDNWDNGVYYIENWEIVGREYAPENEQSEYDLERMLIEIDAHQPVSEQLGAPAIKEYLEKEKHND